MKNILLLLCVFVGFLAPLSMEAQNCPGATRVVSNCKAGTPNDAIGIAMKNFFQDGGSATWRFEPGASFIENTDGTARLRGVIAYYDKPTTRRFDIDIMFIGQTSTAPAGSPMLINTTPSIVGWYYYDWGTATLTGLNDLAGAKLNLKKRGKAFQVGIGAADQTVDIGKFSASGWFSWEIVSQPTNAAIRINAFPANASIDQADICIGLSGSPTVCGAAANCPGATRIATNCKAGTPNDAIGIAMKNFFQDGGSATWRFEAGATFVENTDGTARLKGIIAYYDKPTTRRFEIDIMFIGQTFTPPMGSPVLMNTSPSTVGWYYYDWGTATLTGLNDLSGAKLNLTKRGKAFQVGIGAADQIADIGKFSATGWFAWEIVSQPSNAAIRINAFPANPSIDQADICIGLSGSPTVCNSPCETDNIPPVFTGCPANMTVTTAFAADVCAVASWIAPVATDNCSTPTVTLTTAPIAGYTMGACFPIGVNTITYKATDAKGNMTICTFTVTVVTNNPCINSNLNVNLVGTNATCDGNNGSVTSTVTGGTAPYTYSWSATGSTTGSITGVPGGTYSVTVTDRNGCTATKSVTLTTTPSFSIALGSSNARCNGVSNGSITAAVIIGGTAPFTYLWSNGATTATINNLAAGSYTVTVTDSRGCRATGTTTVTQPAVVSLSTSTTATSCGGINGTATVTASGGTAPYTYRWNTGATTASISNLAAGSFTVTVTDNNGCTATATITVAASANLSVSITGINAACDGSNGSATATVTGGVAPFTYAWSSGATTATLSNIGAGVYSITVTDRNGCRGTASVTITSSPGFSIALGSTNVKCNGGNTGSVTAFVILGGTAPFTYRWSNGATTTTISNLSAGTYSITVTDRNGCTATGTTTVTQPAALGLNVSGTTNSCLTPGSATATVTGGTAPYTYRWSTGATTATISNLAGGSYGVTVTDANGCIASGSVNVISNTSPNLACSVSIVRVITAVGANDGELRVTATGGAAPYTYAWSNGRTTSVVAFLSPGTYTVTVTDNNGCKTTCSASLANSLCIPLTDAGRISGDESFCPGTPLSPILETVQPSGGSGALQYLWMYSTTTSIFNPNTWITIAGETGPNLINVPALTRTAFFIRCVRRSGCDVYEETNVVTKTIKAFAQITGPFSACVGQNVTFTAADLGTTASYAWFFDNANITSSTSRSVTVRFNIAGNQRVSLDVYNLGCSRAVTQTVTVTSCAQGSGTMQSFNLSVVNTKNIKLDWTTKNEELPSKYVVERSDDGKLFNELADMKSQNKAINVYQYDDFDPKMGRAFYRIKHIEANGKISFSPLKKSVLYLNGGDQFMAYPNPVGNQLFVELLDVDNTEGVLELYNAQGGLVSTHKYTKEQTRYEINTGNLPVGNYLLKVRQSNGDIKTIKVNKF